MPFSASFWGYKTLPLPAAQIAQVSSSESIASDTDSDATEHSASELVTAQLSSKDRGEGAKMDLLMVKTW